MVGNVSGDIIYVNITGDGGAFTSIQDAIDASKDGDTVYVFNGTYYENVFVSKTINLTGEDRNTTIIDGGGSGSVLMTRADWINITGFTVKNSGNNFGEAGIDIQLSYYNNISNNIISNNMHGIEIYLSNESNIRNNIIRNNLDGVLFYFARNNVVAFNNISSNWNGIFLMSYSGNVISNNTISSCGQHGISIWDNGNEINGNNVSNNKNGIYISESSSNNITDNKAFTNDDYGIYLKNANKNNLTGNNASNNKYGFYIEGGSDNNITQNNVSNNFIGIYLRYSKKVTLMDNIMTGDGVFIYGDSLEYWDTHNIGISNTLNKKPVYYWKNRTEGVIPQDTGQVILVNCTNIKTENQEFTKGFVGIELYLSSNNKITNNNFSLTYGYGIFLWQSVDNNIFNNKIPSESNDISLMYSNCNNIVNNSLSNGTAIYAYFSSNNTIIINTIFDGYWGIILDSCTNNKIFHNNFMNNEKQAFDNSYNNVWNDTYPSGGNYWSDYSGVDNNKSPNQNIPGKDGIGDTPYPIIEGGAGAKDNYPLMEPYSYKSLENYTILKQGWNLISVPLIQHNQNLQKVLEMIDGYYDAVQWYKPLDQGDQWKHHKVGKPYGNDLFELNETMGFWIHITNPGDTIFLYNGTKPTENLSITLHKGWNMVGYPSQTSYNRTKGLNKLWFGTDVDAIWSNNASSQNWNDMGESDYFIIGKGYYI
ncbi:MAG: right-handed parallel beta-helix repeat-containing protein, partial [Thermoplasmata archaeon]